MLCAAEDCVLWSLEELPLIVTEGPWPSSWKDQISCLSAGNEYATLTAHYCPLFIGVLVTISLITALASNSVSLVGWNTFLFSLWMAKKLPPTCVSTN